MSLTAEQRAAVFSEGCDLAVVAGAGSGKTRVLVERVVHLVTRDEDRHDLAAILAITFTLKAAREMKERLAGEFARIGEYDLRAQVEWAHVSTIHSFCARLLRENAVEAGIDPAFEVLEETKATALLREALAETVEAWRAERSPELSLLTRLAVWDLDEAVISVHSRLRAEGVSMAEAGVPGAEAGVPGAEAGVPGAEAGVPGGDVGILTGALRPVLESIRSLAEHLPGATEAAARKAREVLDLEPDLERLLEGDPAPEEVLDLLADLQGRFDLRGKGPVKEILAELREPRIREARAAAGSVLARAPLGALRDLLGDLDRRYRARKAELGAVDFSDLELSSLELLDGRPDVRDSVAARFTQILVDEYQDVNPVQAAIVDRLRREGNHFAVGDVKQSIYGFRHADPSLFAAYSREVGEGGHRPLSTNFRSAPELVEFTNHCFRKLFEGATIGDWSEMAAAESTASGGEVSLLLSSGDHADEAREAEAESIAELIRGEVDREEFRFGEVAILFRALTHVKVYERALESRGVPYYVVKGRGFYEAREVVDVIRLLDCVRNPRDDVSLASSLRSPFGSMSEDGLLALAVARDGLGPEKRLADLLPHADMVEGLRAADRARWLGFAALLHRLRILAGRTPLRDVIQSALTESGYEAAIRLMPGARRRAANFRKVLDLADSLGGIFDLTEFLSRLKEFRLREVQETEAPTGGEREDVVRLLTVHAAKGLEFPVVVLPDLCRKPRLVTPSILAHGGELTASLLLRPGDDAIETGEYLRQKEALRTREAEESRRLLYVAATRAMRRLVLSAREGRVPDDSWWGALRSVLGEGLEFGERGRAVRVLDVDLSGARGRAPASLLLLHRRALRTGGVIPDVPEADRALARAEAARLLTPPPPPIGASFENTVTELLVHDHCPRCHVERFRLGLPAGAGRRLDGNGREEGIGRPERGDAEWEGRDGGGLDELPPRESGIAVHEVLRIYDPHGRGNLEDVTRDRLQRVGSAGPDLVSGVIEMVSGFYGSAIGSEVLAAPPDRVRREAPLLVRWALEGGEGLILRGQIDLLFPRPDGGLVIVDYKTGRTPPEKYAIQLVTYAMALERFSPEPVAAALIVVLAPGAGPTIHSVDLGEGARESVRGAAERFGEFLRQGAPLPLRHAPGCAYS